MLNENDETDKEMIEYFEAYKLHNLQIDGFCLGQDLCDVSISKNPLAHYAERSHGFAIRLQSVNNNNSNHFYVIQFLLQPRYRDADSSLYLLFKLMETKLKGSKCVLGEIEELVVQSTNAVELESIDMLKSMETDFTKYLETDDLYCLRPCYELSEQGWVYQRPTEEESHERAGIKEKILRFMETITFSSSRTNNYIVQFWAPKDGCCLETWDQPFAFSSLEKGLTSFRKKCVGHKYIVDEKAKEEEVGPPGRVFRNRQPEFFFDLCFYSSSEFSMRNYASIAALNNI